MFVITPIFGCCQSSFGVLSNFGSVAYSSASAMKKLPFPK
jgi:hypothetical protein